MHLTVDTLRYKIHDRKRKGVCSNFLAEGVSKNTPVPLFIQPSKHFRLPQNGDVPIIMVGPGTGIAPFRAFLEERRAIGAKGANWLFFGAQKSRCDFFYKDELDGMQRQGVLTRLDTAFSRDQDFKIYVQHRMLENAAELWSWLELGAHFYVCGDASRMAKDVDNALHEIVRTAGGHWETRLRNTFRSSKRTNATSAMSTDLPHSSPHRTCRAAGSAAGTTGVPDP